MHRIQKLLLLTSLTFCAAISVIYASTLERSNSYYLYTKAFSTTDAGVVAVPLRFKWSIETSWSGVDGQGNDLPDTRVMMRLYDPDQNFTALTAQMDLETAEKLQRELANIIAKKRENPNYQYRPHLYDSSLIAAGDLQGVVRDPAVPAPTDDRSQPRKIGSVCDSAGFIQVAVDAEKHRKNRKLSAEKFAQFANEPNTIVLDARGETAFRIFM